MSSQTPTSNSIGDVGGDGGGGTGYRVQLEIMVGLRETATLRLFAAVAQPLTDRTVKPAMQRPYHRVLVELLCSAREEQ